MGCWFWFLWFWYWMVVCVIFCCRFLWVCKICCGEYVLIGCFLVRLVVRWWVWVSLLWLVLIWWVLECGCCLCWSGVLDECEGCNNLSLFGVGVCRRWCFCCFCCCCRDSGSLLVWVWWDWLGVVECWCSVIWVELLVLLWILVVSLGLVVLCGVVRLGFYWVDMVWVKDLWFIWGLWVEVVWFGWLWYFVCKLFWILC